MLFVLNNLDAVQGGPLTALLHIQKKGVNLFSSLLLKLNQEASQKGEATQGRENMNLPWKKSSKELTTAIIQALNNIPEIENTKIIIIKNITINYAQGGGATVVVKQEQI